MFTDAYGQMTASIASDKEVASIVRRGCNGLDLDDDDRYQFFAIIGQFLNTWCTLDDLHDEGQLPENQWTMVRKDIITLLTMPGGRSFSEDHGKHGVHDAFRNAVDKMLASGEASYTYGKG